MEGKEEEIINLLEAQYLQLVPANKMGWTKLPVLPSERFQQVLYKRLFAPEANIYAPPPTYCKTVLKRYIARLEETNGNDVEINENMLELYASLLSAPKCSELEAAQEAAYVTYLVPLADANLSSKVTLLEKRAVLTSHGHTGSRTWEAALALGEHLICYHSTGNKRKSIVYGRSVLELGAGTGFLSLVAANLGASQVLATDGDSEVCESIQQNFALNKELQSIISVKKLVWGTDDPAPSFEPYDLILGADVTYDTRVIPDLVATLVAALRANMAAVAIIAATVRNVDTLACFEDTCAAVGLTVQMRPWAQKESSLWFYPTDTPIKIFEIQLSRTQRIV